MTFMPDKYHIYVFFLLLVHSPNVNAQAGFELSGKIYNSRQEALVGATVFLDGSEKATATNASGEFGFANLPSGTYKVVVNMLGYTPKAQQVTINDNSTTLTIELVEKVILLGEVVIGRDPGREKNLSIFLANFLGESIHARRCEIRNPEALHFSNKQDILEAYTDEFLIIENRSLGYTIKYLLRNFRHNKATRVTSYDGECTFGELPGSDRQKAIWIANRAKVYEGSLMHFLRALHRNAARQEGFMTYEREHAEYPVSALHPVDMESYVKPIEGNLIRLRFDSSLYVLYKKGTSHKTHRLARGLSITSLTNNSASTLQLYLDKAEIDSRGSLVDYRSFLIRGQWASKRVSEQLPFEYRND